ncbi:reverse transcriptase/maturase family protein [Burkholderia multivorans]|uniref:reverse transcriptase/maturase family protein n=1 Tax=Burkholderia multivorans TaxID=87883 RepID=UPI0021585F37|nr:reverse transcriptase/maturase family protein [Burkholderia multivorans]
MDVNQPEIFSALFSAAALSDVFNARFSSARSKGIDRLSGFQFAQRSATTLAVTSTKCANGSFRFTPYLEVLKLKGRGKAPRMIGIPTVRDRVVLYQLNAFLKAVFPDCIPANIANGYVRQIASDIHTYKPDETFVYGGDIKSFYDAIPRARLLGVLEKRITEPRALQLIRRAIATPTVAKNSSQATKTSPAPSDRGVPQGLAISNILASIYLHSVDADMRRCFNVSYFRYVDDILMYGPRADVERAKSSLKFRLQRRGLGLHASGSNKAHFATLREPFAYLGYVFDLPTITVRSSTVERLLQSLSAQFSSFSHNKTRRLEKHGHLDLDRLKQIFLLELNDRISGAISEGKRYGWIAYFSQINDMTLLHKLDNAVAGMFGRLREFDRRPPPDLKRFARAYFEIKYRPDGNYIRNYDVHKTPAQMLLFLQDRGRIAPTDGALTDEQILRRYQSYVARQLAEMHADEAVIY